MGQRLDLQEILEDILESPNVYFQPPPNVTMQYPCIVYGRDGASRISADNAGYRRVQRYQVTYIDRDPDNPVVEKLGLLPLCTDSRSFVADGLNHDVFELYY
jgi:hypothetical protein